MTTIETTKYARKPFEIEAVQVTSENIEALAEWCSGDLRVSAKTDGEDGEQYIKVRVQRPINAKQTMAFVGDWLLYAGTGWKIYTDKAFVACFDRVEEDLGE